MKNGFRPGGSSPNLSRVLQPIEVSREEMMEVLQNHRSIALIRHPSAKEQEWLAYWDSKLSHYAFVQAVRIESESWRECLDRELAWQFPLRRGKDYLISTMARLHLEETIVDDERQEEQHLAVEFYCVDPYGKRGQAAFDAIPETRWVTNAELLSGQTNDGRLIDQELSALLRRADILPKGT